jgi:hypothetical protein
MRRMNRAKTRLHWEHGYRAHVLRDSRDRVVGRVDLVGRPDPTYHWRTAGARGNETQLGQAKKWVEEAVRCNVQQAELFKDDENG